MRDKEQTCASVVWAPRVLGVRRWRPVGDGLHLRAPAPPPHTATPSLQMLPLPLLTSTGLQAAWHTQAASRSLVHVPRGGGSGPSSDLHWGPRREPNKHGRVAGGEARSTDPELGEARWASSFWGVPSPLPAQPLQTFHLGPFGPDSCPTLPLYFASKPHISDLPRTRFHPRL